MTSDIVSSVSGNRVGQFGPKVWFVTVRQEFVTKDQIDTSHAFLSAISLAPLRQRLGGIFARMTRILTLFCHNSPDTERAAPPALAS